jgi:hypothetical protein
MGMLGELFPGPKPADTGGEDGDGKTYRPRFEIDLDGGTVRLANLHPAPDHPEPEHGSDDGSG